MEALNKELRMLNEGMNQEEIGGENTNTLPSEVEMVKKIAEKIGDLVKFYKTPYGYKFSINSELKLHKKDGTPIYGFDFMYYNADDNLYPKSKWAIEKHHYKPSERAYFDDVTIQDVFRIMRWSSEYILKHKA